MTVKVKYQLDTYRGVIELTVYPKASEPFILKKALNRLRHYYLYLPSGKQNLTIIK